jgi:hypothetical protein
VTATYLNGSGLARILGVRRPLLNMWRTRYPAVVPPPVATYSGPGGREFPLWSPEQVPEWEAFARESSKITLEARARVQARLHAAEIDQPDPLDNDQVLP